MKLRKFIALIVSGALCMALAAGCGSSDSSSGTSSENENKEETALTDIQKMKYIGRTYYNEENDRLWMGLSGSGFSFDYTGDKVSMFMTGNPGGKTDKARVGVYVDGERVKDLQIPADGEIIELDGKGSEPINVTVVKLSECAMSCCGLIKLETNGGTVSPAADKKHRIEIIGDSITCGYGVDDPDMSHSFSTATEDCTKSYSIKTANLLDADYSLVSFSGYGIISGYSGDGKKHDDQLVPTYYDKYGFTYNSSFGGKKPQDLEWDFSRFVPEVVVINLGTNDASYAAGNEEREKEYADSYAEFLKHVREKNPSARIYCTLGTMGTQLNEKMHEAVEAYTSFTGDTYIAVVDFPLQNQNEDGIAADWHPSDKTHTKSAEQLAAVIKADMGW